MKASTYSEKNPAMESYLRACLDMTHSLGNNQFSGLVRFKNYGLSHIFSPIAGDPPVSHTALLCALTEELLYFHPNSPFKGEAINLVSAISLYVMAGNANRARELLNRNRDDLTPGLVDAIEKLWAERPL